jgi:hypothetical protein
MEEGRFMKACAPLVVWLVLLALPPAAAGQDAAGPVSVQGAFGTNVNVGGNTQALSVGFAVADRLDVLVSAERIHLPTEVTHHEGGVSATRGGTTTFVSGEIQVVPVPFAHLSPYALAGAGAGVSRPNVTDLFPDPVTNHAALLFFGGGVRVPLSAHLRLFADVRFELQIEGQGAGVFLFVPVRGGLAWRF